MSTHFVDSHPKRKPFFTSGSIPFMIINNIFLKSIFQNYNGILNELFLSFSVK